MIIASGNYRCKSQDNNPRNGSALIIVLGLLCALMLMGVAFSIQMRVERAGASSYRHGVQARHMIWSGLANALADIEAAMENGTTNFMYWRSEIMVSSNGEDRAAILTKKAFEFVPAYLTNEARTMQEQVKWSYVKNSENQKQGRYAFMIFNVSGLLDGNHVGAETARMYGTNTDEIQLGYLSDIAAPSYRSKLLEDGRYETIPELIHINGYAGEGKRFADFSLAPVGERYDGGGVIDRLVYVGKDTSRWDKEKIVDALNACGVRNACTNTVYKSLVDYVDQDLVPQDLGDGCGEAVPMINEVFIRYAASRAAGDVYNWRCWVNVEWFYPFLVGTSAAFRIECSGEFTPLPGNTHPEMVPTSVGVTNNFNSMGAHDIQFIPMAAQKSGSLSSTNPILVNFYLNLRAKVFDADNNTVDSVPYPYSGNGVRVRINIPGVPEGSTVDTQEWAECVDCRFNSADVGPPDPVNRNWWVYSRVIRVTDAPDLVKEPSLGAENNITKYYMKHPEQYAGNFDGDTYDAYVKNDPMTRAGEMGNLLMEPLTTLRLYDHGFGAMANGAEPCQKVLDYFTTETNDYKRGLLNLNTSNLEVFASAFVECPEREFAPDKRLTWSEALSLASTVISNGIYTNLSELGKFSNHWTNYVDGTTDCDKESLIRNTAGLLTARQNLFIVIIRADSYSESMGGERGGSGSTLASTRAVAEIWRDAVHDMTGNHRTLMRFFRYLED